MVDTTALSDARPDRACALCPPPRPDRAWRLADPGYVTCSACLDRLRDRLKDVTRRYLLLNPRPGASGDHGTRGAPGFGSRSPASDHIIAMRDPRSKPYEVSSDGVQYTYDPTAEAWTEKRDVWYGADGRGHTEHSRPPRSVPAVLAGLAGMVAEDRDITPPPTRAVPDLARWLDAQMDYVSRQPWVVDVDQDIRDLLSQLRPVTGDPRKRIGKCPNVLDEGDTTRVCDAPLHAPLKGDRITCGACRRKWERDEWEKLGSLLRSA